MKEEKSYSIPEEKLFLEAREAGVHKLCVGAGIVRGEKVLLVRRAANDFLGGFYEIPGGGNDEGESLEQTLLREIEEETGLMVVGVLGMFEGFDYVSEEGKMTRQFNFVVAVDEGEVKLSPKEHDEYLWIDSKMIEELDLTPEIRKSLVSLFTQGFAV